MFDSKGNQESGETEPLLQNSSHTDRTVNGAITTESVEVIEEHTEAISFCGALCIPVSGNHGNMEMCTCVLKTWIHFLLDLKTLHFGTIWCWSRNNTIGSGLNFATNKNLCDEEYLKEVIIAYEVTHNNLNGDLRNKKILKFQVFKIQIKLSEKNWELNLLLLHWDEIMIFRLDINVVYREI